MLAPKLWKSLNSAPLIETTQAGIDAASNYTLNRGRDFKLLMENLKFPTIPVFVQLTFVFQNCKEIPDFARIARNYGFTTKFTGLLNFLAYSK